MSFRGGSRGGSSGGNRFGSKGGFRGNSRGGFNKSDGYRDNKKGNRSFGGHKDGRRNFDEGPPEEVEELGKFSHECEGQIIINVSLERKVPFFNAIIYLKNIEPIGKIDEIFGRINECTVSVQLNDNFKASSFHKDQILYIDPKKLLPLERFLPKPAELSQGFSKKRKTDRDGKGNFKKFKNDSGSFGNKKPALGKFGGRKRFNNSGKFRGGRGGGSKRF